MATPRHGNNSTRLSLDIADLPLTPFGMSPNGSSRRRRIFPSQKSNKLSLKAMKSPNKSQQSTHAEKENQFSRILRINDSYPHSKNSNRYTLETVNEKSSTSLSDSESDDIFIHSDNTSVVDVEVLRTNSVENQVCGRNNLVERESKGSNVTVRRRNRRDESKDSSSQRDSIFTDIDDGDFIEFFQGKENGYLAPKSTQTVERKLPQLYYTCQSQNETQFSTSTKVLTAPVGFRKFVEKVKTERPLHNIVEEDVETASPTRRNNFLCDESIITGSADIMRSTGRKQSKALNSTTVGWPAHHVRESLMPGLSDVSSLTLRTEKVPDSDSNESSPYSSPKCLQKQKTQTDVKTIILSSDEEETEVEESITKTSVFRVTKNKNPSDAVHCEKEIVTSQEEYHSFISEDVSIVSSALPVRTYYQQPAKAVDVAPKVLRYDYVEASHNKESTYSSCTSDNSIESDVDDVPLNSRAQVAVLPQRQYNERNCDIRKPVGVDEPATPDDPKTIIPDAACPTVAGWIIASPFKDSSFGTSFLKQRNVSQVSQSVSQQIDDQSSGKSLSCEMSQRLRLLPEIGSPRAVARISGISRIEKSSVSVIQNEKQHTESEDSEVIFRRKSRNSAKVISSDLEDSSSERENSDSGKTPDRSSHKTKDQSASESFHLRLSEEFSKSNRLSEKSVRTIGKDATSPKVFKSPVMSSDNDESFCTYPRKDRNVKNVIISESEDSDATNEESEQIDESFVSLPDIDENKKPVDESTNDLFHQSIVKSSIPDKSTSLIKPSPATTSSMDLKTIENELDNLYSSEWRKNESVVLKKIKGKSQDTGLEQGREVFEVGDTSDEEESPIKRKPKKRVQNQILTSDESEEEEEEENSFLHQIEESSGEEEEDDVDQDDDEPEDYEEREIRKSRKTVKQKHDESYIPESPERGDSSGNDDSFEVYLRNVKKQIAKENKVVDSAKEDLDRYEDSFINDDDESEEDVSFYLPSLAERTKKNLGIGGTDSRHNGSVSGDLPYGKKFIDSKVSTKTRGMSDDPKGSVRSTKKKVTIKSSTSSSWRDSPTITLSSDSDSDEVFSDSDVRKPAPAVLPLITPKNKGRGKVFSKTEGHNRHVSKFKDINRGDSTPTLTFLASLSKNVNLERCHPEALLYTKNFKKTKENLAEKLYTYYNTNAFENKLPATMNIKWNARMTKTAGFCYYQIDRSKPQGRGARIELSTKVIDAPERLRDTLIHELCHAAAWIISGYKDGHGPLWKAWAAKAHMAFPELPAISRCHSYEIACKYTYRCTRCSYSIGRHSKSLDTTRKVCGYCHGKFELLVNSQAGRAANTPGSTPMQAPPKTPRTPGAFALFVKENYGSVKKSKENLKHADVMKILSSEFGKLKASNK